MTDRVLAPSSRWFSAAFVLCTACRGAAPSSAPSPLQARAVAYTPSARELALADTVVERTFRWFWDTTDSTTGLAHDRWPTRDFSSVASIGFALTAYPIGVERRWITRKQSARRTLVSLRYLWTLPQGPQQAGMGGHKGFFYHFLRYEDGRRYKDVELSTIDTSLLLGGVLFAQSYYTHDDSTEVAIRAVADSIYRRVDWRWAMARAPLVSMGWKPESGFLRADWTGYNEGMIVYILGLGSPTHALNPDSWHAWSRTNPWRSYRGYLHANFSSLFGHQYSHVWIDFRGIQDRWIRKHGIDWFENSRRATLSQREYAIANPQGFTGYGRDIWGLTASDGPADTAVTINGRPVRLHTYWARGASNDGDRDGGERDDGTIAPTAAIGSLPFAPEASFPAMVAMRERYGAMLFGPYGFRDSFNPSLVTPMPVRMGRIEPGLGWVAGDHLGIDQGTIILMLENYRSELVWKTMRTNRYLVTGLRRAGFTGGWLDSPVARP
ncbi:MAG: Tat pathway signal protein [Gemmatimonadaceae bacterium]|nr:Tat pathway signal protein [Gemmatimonadaceae bacterium]